MGDPAEAEGMGGKALKMSMVSLMIYRRQGDGKPELQGEAALFFAETEREDARMKGDLGKARAVAARAAMRIAASGEGISVLGGGSATRMEWGERPRWGAGWRASLQSMGPEMADLGAMAAALALSAEEEGAEGFSIRVKGVLANAAGFKSDGSGPEDAERGKRAALERERIQAAAEKAGSGPRRRL